MLKSENSQANIKNVIFAVEMENVLCVVRLQLRTEDYTHCVYDICYFTYERDANICFCHSYCDL